MSESVADQQRHEVQRGWILEFLAIAGFRWMPAKLLLYHLRDMRCPASWKTLNFQLEYLEQKGWLEIARAEASGAEELPEEKRMVAAKITAAGVDRLDRRRAGEEVKF